MERSIDLLHTLGRCSLIVPMSLVCTERMTSIQEKLRSYGVSWLSNYESDSNPGQLFNGVKQNVSILLHLSGVHPRLYTTKLHRFFSEARDQVFSTVQYAELINNYIGFGFAKLSDSIENRILEKLYAHPQIRRQLSQSEGGNIFVHRIAHYYIKCFDFIPYFKSTRDGIKKSEDYKEYLFQSPVEPLVAIINSSSFYFYWQVFYDSFKAGKQCVEGFPCAPIADVTMRDSLTKCCCELMEDIQRNSRRLQAHYTATGNVEYDQFYPRKSKPIMDNIDRVLAKHYGFTDEELDFIINYDIKYRLGRDSGNENEE